MRCRDIPDAAVVDAVRRHLTGIGAPIHLIFADFPHIPEKVLRAKLSKLLRRGILNGCVCGCRGDFSIENERWEDCQIQPVGTQWSGLRCNRRKGHKGPCGNDAVAW